MKPTPAPGTKAGYHHGDLKSALQAAASTLIRQRGVEAVSLREISQAAGVSHAAAYRHYADKQALLANLAEAGFDELAQLIRRATAKHAAAPLAQLEAAGLAYVRFGMRQPHLLQLMFGNAISDWQAHESLVSSGAALAQQLADIIAAGQASGDLRDGNPAELTLTAWSVVHGLALLLVGQRIPGLAVTEVAAKHAGQRCIALMMEGLRNPAPMT